MRGRNKPWANDFINDNAHLIYNVEEENDLPLTLEVGIGKGDFIIANAKANSDYLHIGVELNTSIFAIAMKKVVTDGVSNIRMLNAKALDLPNFIKENSVSKLYLNFSDPWPKSRHEDRRLTSPEFLTMYHNILNDDGCVIFKTDNREFFDYSVEMFKEHNWDIEDLNYNYPFTNNKDDVPTEYERKFRALGTPINFIKVTKELKK